MARTKKETTTAFGRKKRTKPRGRQGGRKKTQARVDATDSSDFQIQATASGNTENSNAVVTIEKQISSLTDTIMDINEFVTPVRKQRYFKEACDENTTFCPGYRIIRLAALEKLISSLACPTCHQQNLKLCERRKGMASDFSTFCNFCESKVTEVNSSEKNVSTSTSNINLLTAASSINCGIGYSKLCSFICGLNIPKPMHLKTFQKLRTVIQKCVKIAADEHFQNVASIVKQEYEKIEDANGNILNIAISYDGSWQKRGHTSLFGLGAVIDLLTGLVIDVEVVSKYCQGCVLEKSDPAKYSNHQCQRNYEGSSAGMEVEAAVKLFQRSEERYGLRYVTMLSDGDSKAYLKLKEKNIYGNSYPIMKEECINHVAKRMGYALRKLKESSKQTGMNMGGKGRLTNEKIDKIQNYYGKALRDNAPDIESMRQAAFASLFHMVATDEEPRHTFCPKGSDSWCHYNRALEDPLQKKQHKPTLAKDIGEALIPIYRRLTEPELLQRCTRSKTQNNNESLHSLIWQKCPKGAFTSHASVKTASLLSAMQFNKGPGYFFDILAKMDIPTGTHQKDFVKETLKRKLSDAVRTSTPKARSERKKTKRLKVEGESLYEPGGF